MRFVTIFVVLFAILFLTACSGTGVKRTYGPYSNWHAMQDRGGNR